MNKFLRVAFSLLLIVGLLFSDITNSTAYASASEIDKLFSDAFNAVKKVVTIGTENGVKPFYVQCEDSLEPGISESEAVAQGVDKGLQIAIYEARVLINELPEEISEYKNTFSSILDNYQHPIFERTVAIVDKNQDKPSQSDIILGRIIIKDLEPVYKAP